MSRVRWAWFVSAVGVVMASGGARADVPPTPLKSAGEGTKPPKKGESLDDMVGVAPERDEKSAASPDGGSPASPSDKVAPPPTSAPVTRPAAPAKPVKPSPGKPAAKPDITLDAIDSAPATGKPAPVKPAPARPAPPPERVTDDNDVTEAAPPPPVLRQVPGANLARRPGPYDLGELDCRVLDGAGVERLLPKKMVSSEEADVLCRVIVTQPQGVAAAQHTLTLSVLAADKVVYSQVRPVRIGSVGRRAIVFVVPADRFASDDNVRITVRVELSAPARPAVRDAKFSIETLD